MTNAAIDGVESCKNRMRRTEANLAKYISPDFRVAAIANSVWECQDVF